MFPTFAQTLLPLPYQSAKTGCFPCINFDERGALSEQTLTYSTLSSWVKFCFVSKCLMVGSLNNRLSAISFQVSHILCLILWYTSYLQDSAWAQEFLQTITNQAEVIRLLLWDQGILSLQRITTLRQSWWQQGLIFPTWNPKRNPAVPTFHRLSVSSF